METNNFPSLDTVDDIKRLEEALFAPSEEEDDELFKTRKRTKPQVTPDNSHELQRKTDELISCNETLHRIEQDLERMRVKQKHSNYYKKMIKRQNEYIQRYNEYGTAVDSLLESWFKQQNPTSHELFTNYRKLKEDMIEYTNQYNEQHAALSAELNQEDSNDHNSDTSTTSRESLTTLRSRSSKRNEHAQMLKAAKESALALRRQNRGLWSSM